MLGTKTPTGNIYQVNLKKISTVEKTIFNNDQLSMKFNQTAVLQKMMKFFKIICAVHLDR